MTASPVPSNLSWRTNSAPPPTASLTFWAPCPTTTKVFKERYGAATQDNVIAFLAYDTENPNSIYSCLTSARENARSMRETISSEMWEQVNRQVLALEKKRNAKPR